MFNLAAMQSLLNAKPFVPFRFVMSDGGAVSVPSRELVMPGKTFALVGILDPNERDPVLSWWTTVWYMHVSRIEMAAPGAPPFTAPPSDQSTSPSTE